MATTNSTPKTELTAVTVAELGDRLTAHRVSLPLLRQVLLAYRANQRRSTASTLRRGQVSGGGRKPWRQKGTGRARVGSSRNPLWRGGGVVFGPSTALNYTQSVTKTARLRSLADAIKLKVKAGRVHSLGIESPLAKTQMAASALGHLATGRKLLVVVADRSWANSFTNLANANVVTVPQLTAAHVAGVWAIVFVGNTWETTKSKFE